MTSAQERTLLDIARFQDAYHYPPTIRELATLAGNASTASVFLHVKNLEAQGLITRTPYASRTIALTTAGRSFCRKHGAGL